MLEIPFKMWYIEAPTGENAVGGVKRQYDKALKDLITERIY